MGSAAMLGQQSPVTHDSAARGIAISDRPRSLCIVVARLEGGAGQLALRGVEVAPPDLEVTIVTGTSRGPLVEAARDRGIRLVVEPLLGAAIDPITDLRALRRLEARMVREQFDIVHTHCSKGGALGRIAAHRAGVPRVVHTYHGFPFHGFQSALRRQSYIAIERRLASITDLTLCVGGPVADEAVRLRIAQRERTLVTYPVVDGSDAIAARMSARSPERRRFARRQLGLPDDASVVGVAGRLTYQKAPEHFLEALGRIGRPGLVGVWLGSGELASRLAAAANAPGAPRFLLAGERTDVLDLLPAFDVFALPSRYEGLPTALVEAMTCGVPVVATDVNAVPQLVVDGETGLLVPPGRPDLLAQAIVAQLDQPCHATAMAGRAFELLRDRFTAATLRSTLAAAYGFDAAQAPVVAGDHASDRLSVDEVPAELSDVVRPARGVTPAPSEESLRTHW
jgi:glycosyltransferase involved in cell wall biosynthesis